MKPARPRAARTSVPATPPPATPTPSTLTPSTTSTPLQWFAVAAPGLEGVLLAEVQRLPGVREATAVEGGVAFAGARAIGVTANRRLRTASRVLLRLGQFSAREFAQLRRRAAALDWAGVIAPARPVRFEISAQKSRLYHTGAIAEALAQAMGDGLGAAISVGSSEAETQRVFARGQRDEWTISVDASGELLHRRGWRVEAGEAPLRETLAAGLLALAGHDPRRPLVDLMCGSGTLAIEAAGVALGQWPGALRRFACEDWPQPARADEGNGDGLGGVGDVTNAGPGAGAAIVAFDQDADMLGIAARNAARAKVGAAIDWRCVRWPASRETVGALPPGPGLVVANPPYGKRLSNTARARALARQLGQQLRLHFPGWRAAIIVPDATWVPALAVGPADVIPLQNGGLRVVLALLDIPPAAGAP